MKVVSTSNHQLHLPAHLPNKDIMLLTDEKNGWKWVIMYPVAYFIQFSLWMSFEAVLPIDLGEMTICTFQYFFTATMAKDFLVWQSLDFYDFLLDIQHRHWDKVLNLSSSDQYSFATSKFLLFMQMSAIHLFMSA